MILPYRSVLRLSGTARDSFLQNILSNDISLASDDHLIYALLLSPQGKVMYDFFVRKQEDAYWLDIPSRYQNEILKKLHLYKLNSDVELTLLDNMRVAVHQERNIEDAYADPRNEFLHHRSFIQSSSDAFEHDTTALLDYHIKRMKLKIPECGLDFLPEEYFALNLQMDLCNALSYTKGCYIGQEVTAKMEYRGSKKKALFLLKFSCNVDSFIKGNNPIFCNELLIGRSLQPYGQYCFALLDKEHVQNIVKDSSQLQLNGLICSIQ